MSIKGLDLEAVRDFSLPGDTENPTIFKIGVLGAIIHAKIYDENIILVPSAEGNRSIRLQHNQMNYAVVRFGLRGVENFTDRSSKPIKFETENIIIDGREYKVASDKFLSTLPTTTIALLAGEILKES